MSRSVILAGGGTGGHIYPNVAIAQRLLELDPDLFCRFVISDRPVDETVRQSIGLEQVTWIASRARPFRRSPVGVLRFAGGWLAATSAARRRLLSERPLAVIATGGFVSAPEIVVARRMGLPTALVSLDATPGRAIRRMRRHADLLCSAYPTPLLPEAEVIGFPLRREVVLGLPAEEARRKLGLEPERRTLLVTAGSQGASTINRSIARALTHEGLGALLAEWQVLHHTGGKDEDELRQAYEAAGVRRRLVRYLNDMGQAWSAADLVVARPGASSVAEAWANRVPALFLPYPFHADEHQRHNAKPMVDAGGAVILRDRVESELNAKPLYDVVYSLIAEAGRLESMADSLGRSRPEDGAARVARWVLESAER
ncbi:UDP-N-acetylglucosamine--N-acetylmuramyl-(pentapeptide) pyrophosphoryl-undecaprenol N-acetylglucosamine transferase [Mucisphaera calidilacus]|uniref:UDP-N-acetylglucosamine--N-acetylmuramyl-(pentapeptide) pyrophosphoryl-undecaprenol N-acetylglucosamine transferase n=1 Tax=Mucisphaera calidilacus TaxID=2527982 RepID=A0A518BZI1_9BACT|nr:glycosyltransferase [Mucisphaera calidilacus]QDU72375.1 UDP-N-acetylglucosamine--N-acetylmuramyl-(pentapeptide) pyrophosphoryl-undecaprenol N-acetylglucosamine transferase MurG [Mucisphaera calidilacus]